MKILIIGPAWVGDMMMSQSLYRTLKSLIPDVLIDVMAPSWCEPLLKMMPEVNQTISMPIGHGEFSLGKRYRLGKALTCHQYDQVIVLPNSFKSALIPFFAGIPKRTGWKGEVRYGLLNDIRVLDKAAFPQMVQRFVALAYPKGQIQSASDLPQPILWPTLKISQADINASLAAFNITQEMPIIALCPGAEFGPAKRWPDYHYAALADMLTKQQAKVLILGSPKDRVIGEQIMSKMTVTGNCINLAGETQLPQAVHLLAASKAVVANDSGLMHIAAALNRPVVALYGPTSQDFAPPLSDKAEILRLITGHHPVRRGDGEQGYHQSLIDMQPEQVFETLMKLLQRFERENS